MLKFNWKPRFPSRGVKAATAWEALEAIRKAEGGLTAENVLQAGSKKRNPLHPIFDWNDAEAAHAHRLEQARGLMRAVEVQVIVEGKKPSPAIRALTCVQSESEGEGGIYYRTMDDLKTAEDQAKHELIRWKKKWKDIATVAKLVGKVSVAAGI